MKMKKEKKTKKRRKQSRALKTGKKCPLNPNPYLNSPRMRSKMSSIASREVKQWLAVEYELNSSKIAVV